MQKQGWASDATGNAVPLTPGPLLGIQCPSRQVIHGSGQGTGDQGWRGVGFSRVGRQASHYGELEEMRAEAFSLSKKEVHLG